MARLSVMVYLGFAIGPFVGEYLFGHHHWWLFAVAGGLTTVSALIALGLPETKPAVAADAPVVPPAAWASLVRLVARPGVAQATVGFGYACLISFLPKYSREIGIGASGPLFVTFAVCTLLVRAVSGPLGDRAGYAVVALPGVACIGLGLTGLALAPHGWMAFPAIALVGVGFGASFPALTALAAQGAPEAERAAALGTFLSFNDLGSAMAGPLVGAISQQVGFRWVYGAPALVAFAGAAVVVSLLPHRAPAPA
jgi:MFS family permease